jgi:Protein of unknown function (DUF3142)
MLAFARKKLVFLPLALFCLAMRPDMANLAPPPGRMRSLPSRTLWVWERPENLRSIDPKTTAVATLDGTILLGTRISVIPRRQYYSIPRGTRRIVVVRIEASGSIAPNLGPAAAQAVLDLASAPDIAALQIDFDARQSQRTFYRSLLRDLRRRMPPNLPLSMTALASWCSNDDWIASLPVDEAVPMFFRMEPGRRFDQADAPEFRIREPLCAESIGISTHESAPASLSNKRLYIFPDRGWREDLPLVSSIGSVPRIQP